jgi:hypothetical protein
MSDANGGLRERREALVREHMESENRHEFEGQRIVCGRVYFDQATILRQLGVAHDPSSIAGRVTTLISHPLTIGRALWKARAGRA